MSLQDQILEYLRKLGRGANTHEIMSACKMESRQVATAAQGLIDKGLLTKRLETAMLKSPELGPKMHSNYHKGKLRVYKLTEKADG